MTRVELVKYCQSKNIVLEAWAPLVRGERFDHPVIVELAKKYNKSPAQILIRYGLDSVSGTFHSVSPAFGAPYKIVGCAHTDPVRQGFIVIPKSTKKNRIADNANVFDFVLEKEDLDRLLTLDEFLVTDWEVSTVP